MALRIGVASGSAARPRLRGSKTCWTKWQLAHRTIFLTVGGLLPTLWKVFTGWLYCIGASVQIWATFTSYVCKTNMAICHKVPILIHCTVTYTFFVRTWVLCGE